MLDSVLIITISGIVGGILNCILVEGGFTKPYTFLNGEGRVLWNPGFLSNVALGIGASFLAWAFGANELALSKQVGLCLVAGIGGGNFISSIIQKKSLKLEQTKVIKYNEILESIINDINESNKDE